MTPVVVVIAIVLVICAAVYGWFSNKSTKIQSDKFNRELRRQLEEMKLAFEQEIKKREQQFDQSCRKRNEDLDHRQRFIHDLREQFNTGFLNGRKWLSSFIAEADRALDESIAGGLRHKSHPALKAADQVAIAKAERREFKRRAIFLKYQLESLEEYFPFLEEYEEIILDEAIPLVPGGSNLEAIEESDRVLRFVPKAEYDRLSSVERNQLALDRYLHSNLSSVEVGRLYERYLGYLYECSGWDVEYHGIIKGYEDMGRDLICTKGSEIKIVQAKCWSAEKLIHEKHIFQLFGTMLLYRIEHCQANQQVSASFETTTSLSTIARRAADQLKIEVKERQVLSKTFPMIKCNINRATGSKIYHLPFDQQYDRTKIIPALGELYASSVAEAEKKGFRHAFRFSGRFE